MQQQQQVEGVVVLPQGAVMVLGRVRRLVMAGMVVVVVVMSVLPGVCC